MNKKEHARWLELKRNGRKKSEEAKEYDRLELKRDVEIPNIESKSQSSHHEIKT